jgi:ATP-dependent RNA helicase RhlE
MTFNDLGIIEPILKALEAEGYQTPTPIQQQAIPIVLQRSDILGCAQTGTGKTAAFAIPILQLLHADHAERVHHKIKVLILTPTRELAIQIGESFSAYGRNLRLRHTVIFGGVSQSSQVDALKKGVDILIATPGRLLDLMNQGFISLRDLSIFVLDEADRMLDMGFIHDVRRVITKLPPKRQTLFFSATMPPEIQKLADTILVDPQKVEVTPVSSTAEKVEQWVYFVKKDDKRHLLRHVLANPAIERVLVFTRTKHGADRVAKDLHKAGINAGAIHGNKSQNARQRALSDFKEGRLRALIATDIAARGIDVESLSHVINFEIPEVPETYVHRIGRTGRAGASGIAISFCDDEEMPDWRNIIRLINRPVPVAEGNPYALDVEVPTPETVNRKGGQQKQNNQPQKQQPTREPRPDNRGGKNNNQPRQPQQQKNSDVAATGSNNPPQREPRNPQPHRNNNGNNNQQRPAREPRPQNNGGHAGNQPREPRPQQQGIGNAGQQKPQQPRNPQPPQQNTGSNNARPQQPRQPQQPREPQPAPRPAPPQQASTPRITQLPPTTPFNPADLDDVDLSW